MGRDLAVYYYPSQQTAFDSEYYDYLGDDEITEEIRQKRQLHDDAVNKRREFSVENARNWDLAYNNYFSGTRRQLKAIIQELWDFHDDSDIDSFESSDDDVNYEAISNLTKILSECPKGWYIVIEND